MFASKKSKIFGAVVALAVAIGGAFYLMPPKVIDPNDPRFDPMQFRFEDYGSTKEKQNLIPQVMLKMFPPGTDKAYVDSMILKRAGGNITARFPDSSYSYGKRLGLFGLLDFPVNIRFDENMKSIGMNMGGGELYNTGENHGSK